MINIEVKKTEKAVTYQKTTTTHSFEVNGKQVQVYAYSSTETDDVIDIEPYEIEQGDLDHLTPDEAQVFEENIDEWMALEVGESQKGDAFKLS